MRLRGLDRLEEAETHYRAILAEHPANFEALLGFGHCASHRNDPTAALERYTAAAEANPSNIWPRMGVAAQLRALGRLEEAEATYRTILNEKPDQPQALQALSELAARRSE